MSSQSFRTFVEQKFGKLAHFVIYALLEWVMIILLFIDGFLAFISNEFAKFFELKIPCLLCTRIDHIFVQRPSNFYYNDSICEVHKKHISSLAYCHVHKKLSDIRTMCEGCLLSFATEKDSDVDRQISLVGMFQKDVDSFVGDEQNQKMYYMKPGYKKDDELVENISSNSWCSCCGDPLKARRSSKLNRNHSMNNNNNAPTPSPRAAHAVSWKNEGVRNLDQLPHLQYPDLKFFPISDIESELPDEEEAASHAEIRRREDIKAVPSLPDSEEISEDATRTPIFGRGNKFFGIPLSDSAQSSPRYKAGRKMMLDMISEPIDNTGDVGDVSELNRLRRQVRLDRKSLIALYMELDEERSASAVAANNAMAMITRLQAEKAAVQMEALQYQRMMEEQAEYDQEAIQELRELVLKREEEIKAVESELEFYRERYGQVSKLESDICEVDGDDDYQELKSQFSPFDDKSDCSTSTSPRDLHLLLPRGILTKDRASSFERCGGGGEFQVQNIDEPSLDFESERSYLLDSLTDLEKELNTCSSSQGGDCSDRVKNNEEEHDIIDKERISSLAKQVHLIRERLKEIEADNGFLKYGSKNLHKGGEGTKLLKEIAQNLRNLRHTVDKIPEILH